MHVSLVSGRALWFACSDDSTVQLLTPSGCWPIQFQTAGMCLFVHLVMWIGWCCGNNKMALCMLQPSFDTTCSDVTIYVSNHTVETALTQQESATTNRQFWRYRKWDALVVPFCSAHSRGARHEISRVMFPHALDTESLTFFQCVSLCHPTRR